jgi:hypothetical protein
MVRRIADLSIHSRRQSPATGPPGKRRLGSSCGGSVPDRMIQLEENEMNLDRLAQCANLADKATP